MTDYKTMRVPADALESARASKRDGETWGEFLRRCTENPPQVRRLVDADEVEIDYAELATRTADELEGRLRR